LRAELAEGMTDRLFKEPNIPHWKPARTGERVLRFSVSSCQFA
jgi:hypothetical protein